MTPVTQVNPLEEAREAALRLLSRMVLVLWAPLLLVSALVRWREVLAQPFMWVIYAMVLTLGWILRPAPSRSLALRARLAIGSITVLSATSMLLNGPGVVNAMGVSIVLSLAMLFTVSRVAGALLGVFVAAMAARLLLEGNGIVLRRVSERANEGWQQVMVTLVLFSGLWFSAVVLRRTIRIYRDAQRALEERQQAWLDAVREAEQLQQRELVATMATGMAHDLANIVQVMTMSAQLLHEQHLDDDSRRAVQDIGAVGGRASEVLRTLLSLGRTTQGTEARFPVGPFLERMEMLLRPLLGRRILLEVQNDAVSFIAADRARVEQVLLNLAVNARDAVPNGGTLQLAAHDESGGVRLEVRDTGTGMTPDVLARLFEPYSPPSPRNMARGSACRSWRGFSISVVAASPCRARRGRVPPCVSGCRPPLSATDIAHGGGDTTGRRVHFAHGDTHGRSAGRSTGGSPAPVVAAHALDLDADAGAHRPAARA